ncbi:MULTISPECIES: multicopper oxidase family protein [unclassified Mesorhizobium]|uniref:multicopper oxidase family protein n=2 Tax=Mesorhizobium TaxID=68287 RepID=UPI0003D04A98|nr:MULTISPECIES: multicopper oxidase family protein [unclassified Mesorhizobium]ESZ04899.1 copper oxidase [Mesorhizobium sp. L48C026A00]RWN99443.1 MAG: multicopper oxidase family protein [Mesorhizobium sp.]TIN26758.1 MAG: multicopper oxidase family protein [Mesorhizobium sp.]TIN41294.1 MAG: multicopper oxidase family protein [Mesorhizobium sp.]TJU86810.1 MAG: multicopper oxidase family protein [Mesorhizobium sp.]
MPYPRVPALTRRTFLASAAAVSAGVVLPPRSDAAGLREFRIRAGPGRAQIAPEPHGDTPIWCYDGSLPGPEIRIRQGERLRVAVENKLNEETTVHWHGLRVPNAMDGVPHLTQAPIWPGETFAYEFDAVDAGTFWYHPHHRSFEQVGRGLYGPLIVEEADPIRVDREVTWVLSDWRLTKTAEMREDFGNRHDMMHNGRVGNTVTINGRVPDVFQVRKGERIRLRLINAANARIFGLDFGNHQPAVIALDGQPVEPHAPEGGLVVLGPAMRADLILDMTADAGSRVSVIDRFYEGLEYRLVDLAYAGNPLRQAAPDWPVALPPNPLPEPDLASAVRHEVTFNGGMMGAMVMQEMGGSMGDTRKHSPGAVGGMMGSMGGMMNMMHSGGIWFINGIAAEGHVMDPMLTLARDKSHAIAMTNATAWHHPIHLHGHSFRVISRNGKPSKHREWQDTVLMSPRERVEIALVADNPGDWMLHCHILEHQAAGMMGVFRVA